MEVTMRRWAKRYDACCNCQTRRYEHRARGYCVRCHPLIKRLQAAKRWDGSDPSTLEYYPFGRRDSRVRSDIEKVRPNYIRQVERQLAFLKRREEMLRGPVDGMTVETELNFIAALTPCKNHSLFHDWAGIFDNQFTPEQRIVLFRGLNQIQECIPWKVVLSSLLDWSMQDILARSYLTDSQ